MRTWNKLIGSTAAAAIAASVLVAGATGAAPSVLPEMSSHVEPSATKIVIEGAYYITPGGRWYCYEDHAAKQSICEPD